MHNKKQIIHHTDKTLRDFAAATPVCWSVERLSSRPSFRQYCNRKLRSVNWNHPVMVMTELAESRQTGWVDNIAGWVLSDIKVDLSQEITEGKWRVKEDNGLEWSKEKDEEPYSSSTIGPDGTQTHDLELWPSDKTELKFSSHRPVCSSEHVQVSLVLLHQCEGAFTCDTQARLSILFLWAFSLTATMTNRRHDRRWHAICNRASLRNSPIIHKILSLVALTLQHHKPVFSLRHHNILCTSLLYSHFK